MKFRAGLARRGLALVASLLLLAQGLALAAPAPGRASYAHAAAAELAELAALVGVEPGAAIICLNDQGSDAPAAPLGHRNHGDCPLCASFGHAALPPAERWSPLAPAHVFLARAVRPDAPSRGFAPRSPAQPRAPPFFV